MDTTNPDIRNQVDDSRGVLKRLQLLIPGFRGYRQLEDLRVADALLRKQVAGILQMSERSMQDLRSSLVAAGGYQFLVQSASVLSRLQQFEGELLHSEQGYSGISPSIRIDAQKLNALYEYDLEFIQSANDIQKLSDFSSLISPFNEGMFSKQLADLSGSIQKMKVAWEMRIQKIEEIKITPGGAN